MMLFYLLLTGAFASAISADAVVEIPSARHANTQLFPYLPIGSTSPNMVVVYVRAGKFIQDSVGEDGLHWRPPFSTSF